MDLHNWIFSSKNCLAMKGRKNSVISRILEAQLRILDAFVTWRIFVANQGLRQFILLDAG